ncbi:flagellar hook-length control protein FliK [Kordiimonas sp. SCSIO 12610]|uniref:flagellar hook-length control protein FliK n=1 Tax=Kordiimonas sp. SCSIO 12610 TaxID=2829597 RepID=UPI00210BECF5|nr:flagellar hook-length control protein FliK [Kordiimonas sp. SCSIO 12610]UTW54530.1 flagellar hook-length control protein FliK [Kordiimonas sp. SCSIO 12610]
MSLTDQIAPTNLSGPLGAGGFFASLGGQTAGSDSNNSITVDFANAIEAVTAIEEVATSQAITSSALQQDAISTPSLNYDNVGDQALSSIDQQYVIDTDLETSEAIALENEVFAELAYASSDIQQSAPFQNSTNLSYEQLNSLEASYTLGRGLGTDSHILQPNALSELERLASSLTPLSSQASADRNSGISSNSPSLNAAPSNPYGSLQNIQSVASTGGSDAATIEGFLDIVNADNNAPSSPPQSPLNTETVTADNGSASQALETNDVETIDNDTASDSASPLNQAGNSGLGDVDFEAVIEEARLAAVSNPTNTNSGVAANTANASTAAASSATLNPLQNQNTPDAGSDNARQANNNTPTGELSASQNGQNSNTGNNSQNQSSNNSAQPSVTANLSTPTTPTDNIGDEFIEQANLASEKSASKTLIANQSGQSQSPSQAGNGNTPVQTVSNDSLVPLTYERFLNTSLQSNFGSLLSKEGSIFTSPELFGGQPSAALANQVKNQFNLAVSRAVSGGEQEFTVRLNPGDLGRVNVRLQFIDNGNLRAQVAVENPETLELLQKDAKGFERALEASGYKAEQNGISFSLEDSNQESAGRALAEAIQQEKARDELAARPDNFASELETQALSASEEEIPLEDILPYVSVDTGVDIRI